MKEHMALCLAVTSFLCITAVVQLPTPTPRHSGTIEGQVIDAYGSPTPRAKVRAVSVDGRPIHGRLVSPVAYTDAKGNFSLEGVDPGKYMIRASKTDEGYPESDATFFDLSSEAVPKVVVEEGQVVQGVLVQLGQKAAKLIIRVTDAETGKLIENAGVILRRDDDQNNYYATSIDQSQGRFELAVPPLAFQMEVSAPGYKTWHSGDTKQRATTILLAPGTTENLSISLQPLRRIKAKTSTRVRGHT
ncbi:MAG: carboxypeptidase-like regulatory domain-containing protein [Acidobacteria bacterium]|nr:carboxypeptidase-like regulatory domain-containing protein [Acidobacteriota bacterium]